MWQIFLKISMALRHASHPDAHFPERSVLQILWEKHLQEVPLLCFIFYPMRVHNNQMPISWCSPSFWFLICHELSEN